MDPAVTYLNHGSFGSCPRPVLQTQQALREEMEKRPVEFLYEGLPARLDAVRERLAPVVGADAQGLVFVPNATTAVNAVLRSIDWQPGDELLVTGHGYSACNRAAEQILAAHGAVVNTVELDAVCPSPEEAEQAVLNAAGPRTRLAMLDLVSSATAWVWPIASMVAQLQSRGIDCLVDGAHGVGLIDVNLEELGAAYFTSNAHKWLCTPKGCAFLSVRADRRSRIRPLVVSHGAGVGPDRARLHFDFDWPGTYDPTATLALPKAIDVLQGFLPGGLPALRKRNHELCLHGRRRIIEALGWTPTAPESMTSAMACFVLPSSTQGSGVMDGLVQTLRDMNVEVAIFGWPDGRRLLRVSSQIYNEAEDIERLIEAFPRALSD